MKKSIKPTDSNQPKQATAPAEPPVPAPPRDPPDSSEIDRKKKKSISIDTTTREAILITSNQVEMIATPQITYKIIRIINHFIKQIIQHHSDDDLVNTDTIWYKKWQSVYSIVRSSKRTMIDNYRLLFDDYSTEDKNITTYEFMLALIEYVPHLKKCYDIKPVENSIRLDYDRFHLTIALYTGKIEDTSNPFAPLEEAASIGSFKPFTENKSISTWHTNITTQSNESHNNGSIVPDDVVVDQSQQQTNDNSQVTTPSNQDNPTPDKSKDSGISFSDSTNSNMKKTVKFTKKQSMIKDEILEHCNKEISNNIQQLQKSLNGLMLQQHNLLHNYVNSQTSHQSHQTPMMPSRPPPTPSNPHIPATPQRPVRNLPSPQPSHHHNNQLNNQLQFRRSGSVMFVYEGSTYELRDSQFAKNSSDLRKVSDSVDLVHFYAELQSDAISYNIFLQQFDMLEPWDKYISNSLPPTCILDHLNTNDNTIDAYNRMKNTLYTKISKSEIKDPEYKAIVKHGSIGKDGFEVLYDLMTLCHPKLMVATNKIRDTNERPHLDENESIYSYAEKLTTWLTIEQIEGLKHTDDQVLNIFMAEMRKNSKYELAVQSINSELTIKDTLFRRTGEVAFPEHLKLYHLPSTVMSYYSKAERNQLFPTDDITEENTAIVNRINSTDLNNYGDSSQDPYAAIAKDIIRVANDITEAKVLLARQGVDQNCEGCGMYGHDAYKTGCDRCAQYIMIKRYLEKHPESERSILSKYKKHQKELAEKRRAKPTRKKGGNNTNVPEKESRHRYNNRYNRAKIQKIQEAIMEAVESESNNSDEASYISATMDASSDTSHE